MESDLSYLLGALGGGGVLLTYYGLKAVREGDAAGRKRGLWMVNAGVVMVLATFAIMIWAGD